jgi:hypothetical protein
MRIALRLWLLALPLAVAGRLPAGEQADEGPAPQFERDIRPILKAHCFHCHGDEQEHAGGLDLRLRRLIEKGGDSGPALAPGRPDTSLILQRIVRGEMPPDDKPKPSAGEVARLTQWIAAGAPTSRPEPETPHELPFTEEERAFWSFQPIGNPAPPAVAGQDRVRTPIDAFLLAELEAHGLGFSPEADKRTLLRRATFDLIGLPPTPEEAAQFLTDEAPDAYERLIDRLLASPHYGERWGRHWLDVAGYADSDGYTAADPVRPYAYKYRDYVIRAINDDKPFDQFIQEQLAGDEMVAPPYAALAPADLDKLIATGFLRMAPDGTSAPEADQSLARNQVVAETIKIVSTSLLGLSVGCAQCHNHRFDPIPQSDYYRLRAVFEPAYDWKNWRPPSARLVSLYTDADRQRAAEIEAQAVLIDAERANKLEEFILRTFERELAKLPEELREPVRAARNAPPAERTAEQKRLLMEHPSVNVDAGSLYLYDPEAINELKTFDQRAADLRATRPVEDFVAPLTEVPAALPPTFLFVRGDHNQPQQELPPGELSVLEAAGPSAIPADDPALPTSGRRLAYARRLTGGAHPLVARVLVNRFWMHHFGRGLVGTPADFGAQGDRPTHPALLDWLAADFVQGGWRLKRLHRLWMTSTAYRQASARRPEQEAIDPDNRLLGRMPVRRLEAGAIRDAILAVSGKLNARLFGPAVGVIEDEVGQFVLGIENLNGEDRPGEVLPLNGEEFRRSLYVQVRRSRPLAVLDTFDEPAMTPNCEMRTASTVAPQALLLMNGEFVTAHAAWFADRVRSEAGDDPAAQIDRAWRLALAGPPPIEQRAQAAAFLTEQTEAFRAAAPPADTAPPATDPAHEALAGLCQALLSANEFLYVD